MVEKLLSVSKVILYGEKVDDMTFEDPKDEKGKLLGPVRSFVRVFGFSYEAAYYGLDAPVIMLLAGSGDKISASTPQDVKNAFSSTLKQWEVDKDDHSSRFDQLTGTVEDILLEVELGGGGPGGSVSGGRVSGGRVSGGRVSGGRVSGGRVSGGRVSGGKPD